MPSSECLVLSGGLDAIEEGYGQTYNKPIPEVAHQPHLAWTIDGGMEVSRILPVVLAQLHLATWGQSSACIPIHIWFATNFSCSF